jgi:hypothetical protein
MTGKGVQDRKCTSVLERDHLSPDILATLLFQIDTATMFEHGAPVVATERASIFY